MLQAVSYVRNLEDYTRLQSALTRDAMSQQPNVIVSVVGIVADLKRDFDSDYVSRKCNVYGVEEAEYNALAAVAEVRPRRWAADAERIVVLCNPWRAMRALGRLGYYFSTRPLGGRVGTESGERRVCIWTMVKTSRGEAMRTDHEEL